MDADNDFGTMESGNESLPDSGKEKSAPKKAKITDKDWEKVETHLKQELQSRKTSEFRKSHEAKWKEVDRQINMEAMIKVNADGSELPMGWHNSIELGELSKASENISADVRRILFPPSRFWFEPHADCRDNFPLNPQTGEREPDQKVQGQIDGRLRSLMVQQHEDFGLKDRVELSVKEALHHGSFVAEVVWEEQEMIFEATKVKVKGAPVLIPHSMWNCYPDPSPSVLGTQMFYTGTMFIEWYLPRYKCEQLIKSGEDGWMPKQWKKVPKDEHTTQDGQQKIKDVKITSYWGDIVIERTDEDLYYPNHKVYLFNGKLVYMAPNDTPYPPLIFKGYERTDVRDPYSTSPIIKQSPMQKLASVLANKTVDGVELHIEPPIVYDGNDPDFVLNGGPVIAPGAKTSTKSSSAFREVKIGDPSVGASFLQWCVEQMKEKLGRPGKDVGDRATKAEVVKSSQDQEVSLVDFIGKVESALRTYLYMQHAMNLERLDRYTYYSPETDDPDFLVATKKDLPKAVNFEVVGARGVLGEEERSHKMAVTTAFLAGSPLFAPLLDAEAIALHMYADAGIKNAEHLLKEQGKEDPAQLKAALEQAKQLLQKLNSELQQEKQGTAVKLKKIETDNHTKMTKIAVDHQTKVKKIETDHSDKLTKIQTEAMHDAKKLGQELKLEVAHLIKEVSKEMRDYMADRSDKSREQAISDAAGKATESIGGTLQQLAQALDQVVAKQESMEQSMKTPKSKRARKVGDSWIVDTLQ